MALPSLDGIKSDGDYIIINGRRLSKEQINKLRQTKRWKTYFNTLRPRDSNGNIKAFPKNTNSKAMSEEDYKKYIDKMVLLEVDTKNPGNTFDEFYRNYKNK